MRVLKSLTVKDEKVLNSLLKNKKSSSYILLYYSDWDKWSNKMLKEAEAWASKEGDEVCYLISSWELPHAFAAFSISSAPTVVEVINGDVKVYVEYPRVHRFFNSRPKKKKNKKARKGPRIPA